MGEPTEVSAGRLVGVSNNAPNKSYRTSSLFPPATFVQQLGLDRLNFTKLGIYGSNSSIIVGGEGGPNNVPTTTTEEEASHLENANINFVRSTSKRKITMNKEFMIKVDKPVVNDHSNHDSNNFTDVPLTEDNQRDSMQAYYDELDDSPDKNRSTNRHLQVVSKELQALSLTDTPPAYFLPNVANNSPKSFQDIPLLDTPREMRSNSTHSENDSTIINNSSTEKMNSVENVKQIISKFFSGDHAENYIYESPDTESNIVYDESGKIKTATFVKIVEKLTDDKFGDSHQLFVFLNTYRTFTTPLRLLQLLSLRYNMPTPRRDMTMEEIAEFDKAKRRGMRLRVMVVFKNWIEGHWNDWHENEELVQELTSFITRLVEPSGLQRSAEILTNLMAKKRLEQIERDSLSFFSLGSKQFDFWSYPTSEIAMQLTMTEFAFFHAIKPHEFLKLAWAKKNARQNAPNIMASIEFFNKVAEWIKTEMLVEDNLQRRIDKLSKFLEIGEKMLHLNNFNGVAEIVAALDSSPVYRLKRTWGGLSEQKLEIIQNLRDVVAPAKSYAKLREKLHTATPPCVPYLGMYLTDLTFIDEGNTDIIAGMVNFSKCMMISDVLREIQLYQQTKFAQKVNPQFKKYVTSFEGFSDEDAYDISLEIEPRTRNHDEAMYDEVNFTSPLDNIGKNPVSPPQELLSVNLLQKKSGWGKKPVLNLSDDPFFIHLQLLGATEALTVRLPPRCAAKHALQIFEENFRGITGASTVVLVPSPVYPCGRIIEDEEYLDDYAVERRSNDGISAKPVLMVWRDPCNIRVGVSRNNTVERTEEMIVDLNAPLFSMVPIFQSVFFIKDEFSFLYIEGSTIARWMNMGRTLDDQAFDFTKGFLLLFPLLNLLTRPLSTLGNAEKSGFLTLKKKDFQSGKFSFNMLKRRFFTIHDHFLIWFGSTEPDALPRALISLEHFTARLGSDKVLTLFRHFRGFSSTISKYNVYKLTAHSDDEIVDWFSIIQKCRGSIGDQAVFGIPLAVAAGRRGNKKLPLVVERTITYLSENDLYNDQLFTDQCNPELLEHYIDQFDQGATVDFSVFNHPPTVAQLLLVYLDMLPAPVLTHELYEDFLDYGTTILEGISEAQEISELAKVVSVLPEVNRAVMCYIFEYLHSIAEKEESDDMAKISRKTLAKVFGPVLLKANEEVNSSHVIHANNRNNSFPLMELVIERLLFYCKQVFNTKGSEGKIVRRARVRHKLTMIQGASNIDLKSQIAEMAHTQMIITDGTSSISGTRSSVASSFFSPIYERSATMFSAPSAPFADNNSNQNSRENERVQSIYGTLNRIHSRMEPRLRKNSTMVRRNMINKTKSKLGRDISNESISSDLSRDKSNESISFPQFSRDPSNESIKAPTSILNGPKLTKNESNEAIKVKFSDDVTPTFENSTKSPDWIVAFRPPVTPPPLNLGPNEEISESVPPLNSPTTLQDIAVKLPRPPLPPPLPPPSRRSKRLSSVMLAQGEDDSNKDTSINASNDMHNNINNNSNSNSSNKVISNIISEMDNDKNHAIVTPEEPSEEPINAKTPKLNRDESPKQHIRKMRNSPDSITLNSTPLKRVSTASLVQRAIQRIEENLRQSPQPPGSGGTSLPSSASSSFMTPPSSSSTKPTKSASSSSLSFFNKKHEQARSRSPSTSPTGSNDTSPRKSNSESSTPRKTTISNRPTSPPPPVSSSKGEQNKPAPPPKKGGVPVRDILTVVSPGISEEGDPTT